MSKLLMFDFECLCGHQFEELIESDKREARCPKCEHTARAIISPVRSDWRKMGLDSGFPSAQEKWAKMQEQKSRKEDSVNLVHY
jgi:DNA-directed RNA polymerase subunit RPC12/RpoP